MGQNTSPFGQKTPPSSFTRAVVTCLHSLVVWACHLFFSCYGGTLRVCTVEIPNSWVLWGAWMQGWESPQPGRLWLHQGTDAVDSMASGFSGFSLFSLPSCSNSRVLDIFQINIKRWFEKQTLSSPSKGKGNMHLNENSVFY